MKSVELKFGRLSLKVMRDKLMIWAGDAAGQRQGLHFTQFFEPLKGKLRPHLTMPGKPRHFLGDFRPKRFTEVMKMYERELMAQFLKAVKRVEPDELEQDGWFFLCPEVTQQEWNARFLKNPETLRITEEAFEDAEELALRAARPAGMLHQVKIPTRPQVISAFRLTDTEGCSESAFIYFFPDGLNDKPGWYIVPRSVFNVEWQAEFMLRHLPSSFWKALLVINDRLKLGGDREKLMRFTRGVQ